MQEVSILFLSVFHLYFFSDFYLICISIQICIHIHICISFVFMFLFVFDGIWKMRQKALTHAGVGRPLYWRSLQRTMEPPLSSVRIQGPNILQTQPSSQQIPSNGKQNLKSIFLKVYDCCITNSSFCGKKQPTLSNTYFLVICNLTSYFQTFSPTDLTIMIHI